MLLPRVVHVLHWRRQNKCVHIYVWMCVRSHVLKAFYTLDVSHLSPSLILSSFLRLFGVCCAVPPVLVKRCYAWGANMCESLYVCMCVYVCVCVCVIRQENITRWRYEDWTLHFIHVKNRARAHFIVSRAQI